MNYGMIYWGRRQMSVIIFRDGAYGSRWHFSDGRASRQKLKYQMLAKTFTITKYQRSISTFFMIFIFHYFVLVRMARPAKRTSLLHHRDVSQRRRAAYRLAINCHAKIILSWRWHWCAYFCERNCRLILCDQWGEIGAHFLLYFICMSRWPIFCVTTCSLTSRREVARLHVLYLRKQ